MRIAIYGPLFYVGWYNKRSWSLIVIVFILGFFELQFESNRSRPQRHRRAMFFIAIIGRSNSSGGSDLAVVYGAEDRAIIIKHYPLTIPRNDNIWQEPQQST